MSERYAPASGARLTGPWLSFHFSKSSTDALSSLKSRCTEPSSTSIAFAFADLIGIRMRCSADDFASSMNLSTISCSAALAISAMSKSCGLILVFVEQLQPPLLLQSPLLHLSPLAPLWSIAPARRPRELVREPANDEPALEPLGLKNVALRIALIT